MTIKYLQSLMLQLQTELQFLQQELSAFPNANLQIHKNGIYQNYFDTKSGYIPKKNVEYIQTLAMKKYKELQYQERKREYNALRKCIAEIRKHPVTSTLLLEKSSPYFHLLQNQMNPFSEDYEHCLSHPEHLIHKTLAGHMVRSKSEVLIANTLFLKKIPYRYECALHLNDITLYPDFTILHPITSSLWYFEHFGLMDNSSYRNVTFQKLKLYSDNNIIPSINLLTTFETKQHPINSDEIDFLINKYLLCK